MNSTWLGVLSNYIFSSHIVIHARRQIQPPLLPVSVWGFSYDIVP